MAWRPWSEAREIRKMSSSLDARPSTPAASPLVTAVFRTAYTTGSFCTQGLCPNSPVPPARPLNPDPLPLHVWSVDAKVILYSVSRLARSTGCTAKIIRELRQKNIENRWAACSGCQPLLELCE